MIVNCLFITHHHIHRTHQVFQRMEAAEKRQNAMRIPGFLSTHPAFPDRIAQLRVKVLCVMCVCCFGGGWSGLLRVLQLAVAQCSSKCIQYATTGGAGALRVRGRPGRQRRVGVGRRGGRLIDYGQRRLPVCMCGRGTDGTRKKQGAMYSTSINGPVYVL